MKKKNINLTRETANLLLLELKNQAVEALTMSKEQMPYYTTHMAVFGSYLDSNKDRLGDLDIFVEINCKWDNLVEMQRYFHDHPSNKARTILQRIAYGKEIFLRHMKNQSTAITLHDMADRQMMQESNPEFKCICFLDEQELILEIKYKNKCLQEVMENCDSCLISDLGNIRKKLHKALDFLNLERIRQKWEIEKKMEMQMINEKVNQMRKNQEDIRLLDREISV